jgi:hypothetical protein
LIEAGVKLGKIVRMENTAQIKRSHVPIAGFDSTPVNSKIKKVIKKQK